MVGVQWPDSSSRRGKPGCSLCPRTEREFGRPEEQFGSETTRGILPQRGRDWVEQNSWLSFKSHKKPQEKRCGGRGAPARAAPTPRSSGMRFPAAWASSLLLLPRTPAPSRGVQEAAPAPRALPGHRDELELLHGHDPWICVHSRGPNPPVTPGKMGKPEVRLCWINPARKRNFPEPRERGGTLCPTHGCGWEHPGDAAGPTNIPCVHATQPSDKNRL